MTPLQKKLYNKFMLLPDFLKNPKLEKIPEKIEIYKDPNYMTSLFTYTPNNLDEIKKILNDNGFVSTLEEGNIFQVLIELDLPSTEEGWIEAVKREAHIVLNNLQRLNTITDLQWFLAGSHPDVVSFINYYKKTNYV